jgi:hypothetical protein
VATTIKARLYSAARLDAGLVALLGTGSPMVLQWHDMQVPLGGPFPAVGVSVVSNPRTYAVSGRLPTGFSRIQFDVFGTGNDSQEADQIVTALAKFLDGFSGGTGVTGKSQYSNLIVSDRDAGIAQTQPLTYRRIVDAMCFVDDIL